MLAALKVKMIKDLILSPTQVRRSLLTGNVPDPDILIRTSGERRCSGDNLGHGSHGSQVELMELKRKGQGAGNFEPRLSNFLMFQLAYAELFFLDKHWPEVCAANQARERHRINLRCFR